MTTTAPTLIFRRAPGLRGHDYEIANWEAFDQYARLNWSLWVDTIRVMPSLWDTDQLKVMLAAHALELERLKREYTDYVRANPPATVTNQ